MFLLQGIVSSVQLTPFTIRMWTSCLSEGQRHMGQLLAELRKTISQLTQACWWSDIGLDPLALRWQHI